MTNSSEEMKNSSEESTGTSEESDETSEEFANFLRRVFQFSRRKSEKSEKLPMGLRRFMTFQHLEIGISLRREKMLEGLPVELAVVVVR